MEPVDASRNAETDRCFAAALELPSAERSALLAALHERDPGLADSVRQLLAAAEQGDEDEERFRSGHCLAGPVWDELADEPATVPPGPAAVGDQVGVYRIVGELGRGGMSIVYLAERADELFEHRVALKFMSLASSGRAALRRFERERQILATLNHPGIARLLDGRVDDRGFPYLVMELVEGMPIDRFVRENDLGLHARLDLFMQVADAVGYAHRNLVVHRDLKPSNILVTAEGRVKLLDFGIARLLAPGPGGGEDAPATRGAARILTPEYASPEQVMARRITTSSDLYQLGLLLFELLTGMRPFDLEGATAAEIERVVCETTPTRPSAVVNARRVADSSSDRQERPMPSMPPAAAVRRLRGDLDNIVLKALEKEPERRYAAVGDLYEDLRRHLAGLPVLARKPTIRYRIGRFVRRHAAGAAAAATLLLLLVGYAVTVTVQGRRVAAEAARAEQMKEFLAGLFIQANPGVNKGMDPTATELVAAGADRLAVELRDQPEIRGDLMALLGEVYGSLGHYDLAVGQLRPALEVQRELHGPLHPEVMRTGEQLGRILHYDGRYEEAESLLREVLETRRRLFGTESREVGETLNDLGDLLHSRGELPRAERILRLALRIQTSVAGEDAHEVARVLRDLGNVLRDRGLHGEAEAMYRRSLEISRSSLEAPDPIIARTANELAVVLARSGGHDEADAVLRDIFAVYEELYPDGHPMIGTTFRNLGLLRLEQGRPGEAREALERSLASYGRHFVEDNGFIPRARRYLARALLETGRPADAAVLADSAASHLRRIGLSRHPALADALATAGLARLEEGRSVEGLDLLRRALALREASSAPSDPAIAALRLRLERAGRSRDGVSPPAASGSFSPTPARRSER